MSYVFPRILFWIGLVLIIFGLIGNPVLLGFFLIIFAMIMVAIKDKDEKILDKYKEKHYKRKENG